MTSTAWALVELASRLLERDKREAVLGDLQETEESGWEGLLDVLGLVVRLQIFEWRNWRPWLAVFGLALPGSLLLMGFSVSMSSLCERLVIGSSHPVREAFFQLLCLGVLLIGGSWAWGFVIGSMSRRTLWMSIASSCLPCLFCFMRFREPSLSRLCLFLFLLPAIWGVRQALRFTRVNLRFAIFLAIAITMLTILPANIRGVWALSWSLVWPAWYIVATTQKTGVQVVQS